jgi:DNA-binding CsgD family transcriptional regulator
VPAICRLGGAVLEIHPADPGFGGEVVFAAPGATGATTRPARRLGHELTERQRQVIALVHRGSSNKEIAAELAISLGTVKKHLELIYGTLGVTNRTAALHRLEEGRAPSVDDMDGVFGHSLPYPGIAGS